MPAPSMLDNLRKQTQLMALVGYAAGCCRMQIPRERLLRIADKLMSCDVRELRTKLQASKANCRILISEERMP